MSRDVWKMVPLAVWGRQTSHSFRYADVFCHDKQQISLYAIRYEGLVDMDMNPYSCPLRNSSK